MYKNFLTDDYAVTSGQATFPSSPGRSPSLSGPLLLTLPVPMLALFFIPGSVLVFLQSRGGMKGSFVTLSEDIRKQKTLNHKKATSKRTDAEGTRSICAE